MTHQKNKKISLGILIVILAAVILMTVFPLIRVSADQKSVEIKIPVFATGADCNPALFDEDGNPLSFGKNNIVAKVNVPLAAGEGINGCISLDPFLFEIPDYEYEVDYLYVSLITYEDDSVWSDPFGLCKL